MAKTFHLDLAEAGFEGMWVDLYDPRFLSQRKFEELVARMSDVRSDAKAAEQALRDRVAAWHLVDPDTEQDLNDPKTDDLGGLPVGVLSAIGDKINDLFEATVPLRSRKA